MTTTKLPPGRSRREATRYREKNCAECGAPFDPTSGRQRYCDWCRDPKLITARNTESKQRQRSEPTIEDLTRPPRDLRVRGQYHRRLRVEWVRDALIRARELHRDRRLGASQEIVKLAVRTADGEVGLVGCHHLGELLVHFDTCGFFLSPFAPWVLGVPAGKRGQDLKYVSAGQRVMGHAEMSESEAGRP